MMEIGPDEVSAIRARFAKRPAPGTKVWTDDRTYVVVSDKYPEMLALCDALEKAWARVKELEHDEAG